MQLSKKALPQISNTNSIKPVPGVFQLPEKVLQFGTGVLLRGLPDYFIDKANGQGIFNGRIVVVKSTDHGDATAFDAQDNLYTLCIRGLEKGETVEENRICAPISRVLSANQQWQDVLACAQSPELTIIISNTTEVGIQLVNESIFETPPQSFPAKLLAVLYARFKKLGASAPRLIVLPTELLSDNGKKLQAIVTSLARFNKLEEPFLHWLDATVSFCNTLVDCIVPGMPEPVLQQQLENDFGYTDALMTISEVYRLWAIEGDDDVKALLSFAQADPRVIITNDITKYKELKLRLLNGTHTLSCGLAHAAGIVTVKEAMSNPIVSQFISRLMLHEIAQAIPFAVPQEEAQQFGMQVLDRFRNPFLQHQWLSISLQYTSKLAMRVVPVLLQYYKTYKKVPEHISLGVAAYLLFMKAVKQEGNTFWGEQHGVLYAINDDKAAYYFELWQQHSPETVVKEALSNESVWGADVARLDGFEASVLHKLQHLLQLGAFEAIVQLQSAS